jgi:hypothetical protein
MRSSKPSPTTKVSESKSAKKTTADVNSQQILTATIIQEAARHAAEASRHLRSGCAEALQAGLRLLWIHQNTVSDGQRSKDAGFESALSKIGVTKSTAYRWLNAAYGVLCRESGLQAEAGDEYLLPRPGSVDWKKAEKILSDSAQGMSLRRLMLGAPAAGDICRLNELISNAEEGDTAAEDILERIEKGEIDLVQGIRAAAGASATKSKKRKDPVYLDLDGRTGEPRGLFVKSLITITNTFSRWDSAPEPARRAIIKVWKEVVANLPKELR